MTSVDSKNNFSPYSSSASFMSTTTSSLPHTSPHSSPHISPHNSPSTSSNNNLKKNLNNENTESSFVEVEVLYPNGDRLLKKIDAKKAIYDLLIELLAAKRLIPTNFTLILYGRDEKDNDASKIIEYSPNQAIGQLNPTKIKIVQKTLTLKHYQHKFLTSTGSIEESTRNNLSPTHNPNSLRSFSYNKPTAAPFELTICVQVNLPFNQKTAVRVKKEISVEDLFSLICKEANLDMNKFELKIGNIEPGAVSMKQPFEKFNTKEVELMLKRLDASNAEISKMSSESKSSIFSQLSSKRHQPKILQQINGTCKQQQQQQKQQKAISRSKSEVDLNVSDQEGKPKRDQSQSNLRNKLCNTLSSSSMFGFFSRRKNTDLTKSKTSLNSLSIPVTLDEKDSTPSNNTQNVAVTKEAEKKTHYTGLFIKAKKRPAPPPPTQSTQIQQTNEIKIATSPIIKNEPKQNTKSIDENLVDRIKNNTKSKKPAPPPPSSTSTSSVISPAQPIYSPKSDRFFQSNNSSLNSSSCESEQKKRLNTDSGQASSASASSSPPPSSHAPHSLGKSVLVVSFSANASSSPIGSPNSRHTTRPLQIADASTIYHTHSFSSELDDSSSVNTHSSSKHEKVSELQNEFGYENDSLASSSISNHNENDCSNYSSLNTVDEVAKSFAKVIHLGERYLAKEAANLAEAVETNEVTLNSSEFATNNESIKTEANVSLNNETSQNCVRSFHGAVADQKSYSEDELSENDASKHASSSLVESTQKASCENIKPNPNSDVKNEPEKFAQFEKSRCNSENLYSVVYRNKQLIASSHTVNSNTLPLNRANKSKLAESFKVCDGDELNRGSQLASLLLRSPSSPPPHFPAIGENEVNERHQNYTVIRSGDIIEKNGTYYSTDGTVRGYSGTVRKIANSKTLSEIFARQKELELEREKEHEMQQKVRQEEERKSQAELKSAQLNNVKQRVSLGNIIENEKKTNAKSSSNFKRYSEVNNSKPLIQTIESELSKKLEDRRQLIENNLKVDTNLRQTPSGSNSAVSSASSNSFTVSSDLSNPSLMSPKSASFDPQTTSSTTSFSFELSANRTAHNQQKSPSFVLSAKNKINHGSKSLLDSVHQNRNNLLNELKMTVPLIDDNNNKLDNANNNNNSLIQVVSTKVESEKLASTKRPSLSLKNSNQNTHKSPKNQLIGDRDNLMDAIKSFSVNSLRRIGNEIQ